MTALAPSFFIGSSSFLQAKGTPINAQMGSKFGNKELSSYLPLRVLKNLHKVIMGEILFALKYFQFSIDLLHPIR